MEMSKQQATFLQTALEQWEKDQLLPPETAHNLRQSIVVRPFDWRRLARYSFWASLACVLIALGALLFDDWLLKMAARLFEASSFFLCLFFGILSGLCYTWAFYRRKSHPQNTYSNEALVLLGSIGTATALGFGGHALGSVEQHLGALTLLATLIYGTLGIFFKSGTMWFYGRKYTFAVCFFGRFAHCFCLYRHQIPQTSGINRCHLCWRYDLFFWRPMAIIYLW